MGLWAAVAAHQGVTAVWYAYPVFGRVWMSYVGQSSPAGADHDVPQTAATLSLATGFLLAAVLHWLLLPSLGIASLAQAAATAVAIWSVTAPLQWTQYIAMHKSAWLALIDVGHNLAILVAVFAAAAW